MRIQKYLSQAWICSRRQAEAYIERWEIFINWEKAQIWQIIDVDNDVIKFWKNFVHNQNKLVYYKLNKPRWVVTTSATHTSDTTIMDIIDIPTRVFPIWRLDKATTWLILLTNDGRLTNFLIHPRYNHKKTYIVETFWSISDEALDQMSDGIFMLWRYTKKAIIKRISSWKFYITITEWRNRQIRRMVEAVWSEVKKLKRIQIENIKLWNLKIWQYVKLSTKELDELFDRMWIDQNPLLDK